MTAQHLLQAIGRIDDRYVAEAEAFRRPAARRIWVRWVAAAACLLLILTAAIPLLLNGVGMGGMTADSAAPQENESAAMEDSISGESGETASAGADGSQAVWFNGAYYLPVDSIYGDSEELLQKETENFIGLGELAGEPVELYRLEGESPELIEALYADGSWGCLQYAGPDNGNAASGADLLALYGAQSADALERAQLATPDGEEAAAFARDEWMERFYAAFAPLAGKRVPAGEQTEAGRILRLSLENGETLEIWWEPESGLLRTKSLLFETNQEMDALLQELKEG